MKIFIKRGTMCVDIYGKYIRIILKKFLWTNCLHVDRKLVEEVYKNRERSKKRIWLLTGFIWLQHGEDLGQIENVTWFTVSVMMADSEGKLQKHLENIAMESGKKELSINYKDGMVQSSARESNKIMMETAKIWFSG